MLTRGRPLPRPLPPPHTHKRPTHLPPSLSHLPASGHAVWLAQVLSDQVIQQCAYVAAVTPI
jgi:hypothetical protein